MMRHEIYEKQEKEANFFKKKSSRALSSDISTVFFLILIFLSNDLKEGCHIL